MDDFDASDLSALFAEVDELQARGRAPQNQYTVSPAVHCDHGCILSSAATRLLASSAFKHRTLLLNMSLPLVMSSLYHRNQPRRWGTKQGSIHRHLLHLELWWTLRPLRLRQDQL